MYIINEDDETGETKFDCGCILICEVIEGEKTATLKACDNPACFVRTTVEKETRNLGRQIIYGDRDGVQ